MLYTIWFTSILYWMLCVSNYSCMVHIHSLNNAWVLHLLLWSHFYSPGAPIDSPLVHLCSEDIYEQHTDALAHVGSLLPSPPLHSPLGMPYLALFNPQGILYRIFCYVEMFTRLIDIFSTREECTGASG
ncbi:hypothetical protein M405DRAFT_213748 [Rhizopogon salebrosus TDB-379]|nr:hypothetical protein M405DRAFT_213748 [Rhizopogon salebrosus TDB-379]